MKKLFNLVKEIVILAIVMFALSAMAIFTLSVKDMETSSFIVLLVILAGIKVFGTILLQKYVARHNKKKAEKKARNKNKDKEKEKKKDMKQTIKSDLAKIDIASAGEIKLLATKYQVKFNLSVEGIDKVRENVKQTLKKLLK